MANRIKWEVEPAPTGRYGSFEKRGWPIGFLDGDGQRVLIRCNDEYVPARVKTGDHSELTVSVDIYDNITGKTKLATLKQRAKTLKEAKELAEGFFARNPGAIHRG